MGHIYDSMVWMYGHTGSYKKTFEKESSTEQKLSSLFFFTCGICHLI